MSSARATRSPSATARTRRRCADRAAGAPAAALHRRGRCSAADLPGARATRRPSGRAHGLAGGAHPAEGEVALSLERMTGVEELDREAGTLTALAGTPLKVIQDAAEAAGFLCGIDLGARGSCSIGGNVATNAGGNQVLRYGMTRRSVLGLEVVLADGTVLRLAQQDDEEQCGLRLDAALHRLGRHARRGDARGDRPPSEARRHRDGAGRGRVRAGGDRAPARGGARPAPRAPRFRGHVVGFRRDRGREAWPSGALRQRRSR